VSSLVPTLTPPGVSIFASDCATPKTIFNLRDTDTTVCAVVTNAGAGRSLIWSDAKFLAVQNVPITNTTSFNNSFALNTNSSLGDWRVIVYDPAGDAVQAVTTFTVLDSDNPTADLNVGTSARSAQVAAGSQAVFSVQVTNYGPSPASNVTLTDAVPANTTFVSFSQIDGPVFTCTNPNAGDTGTTSCTIGSLNKGDVATFLATYTVSGSASVGTEISNEADVGSNASNNSPATADSNTANNSSVSNITVLTAPCVLTCPVNIVQNTDSGQAGAIVSYSTPSHTGDCGQDSVGESGETISAITCSPASGSFFDVGTTSVICSAQTGAVCTFQVTINNPGGLSISLNGANPLSLECGTDFADPGATAVNASGQSIPVTVTLPQGFNPNATAVGSYTLTYTATDGSNSTSTTRTVNVADTRPPEITINGSNPFKIQQGTCLPFVDPGVSANDGCAGREPVSSSISGPNGLTSIDPNTPGTYTITYTASDGTRMATATRTVLVGNFPPDEQDLGTANGAPVIKLIGGDPETGAITVECGFFVDPGATATNSCRLPLPYTVTGTVLNAPGTYILTYTVTDNNQTASISRSVTITPDNTAPTITLNGANPLTVECHGTFSDPGATAHDACAGNFAATASGTVDVNTVGTYIITYNATDPTGHVATPVTRTVHVVDTTPPVVTAPPNVTVGTGPNATICDTLVSEAQLGTATANDLCQGSLPVTRSGVPAGNVFPVGQTIITYSATDASGNTSTATQKVTVVDNTPPVISCPASITLDPTCPSGAIATYTAPVGTDNCGSATTARTTGLASGSVFPIGTTTVTFTVTDAAGNAASCGFQVRVKTAAQTIQDMMTSVQALQPPLAGTQIQGLNSKLQAAFDAVNQGKTTVACNKLADFISQVTAFINNGTLTSAQGTPLITSANHVRNTIGCTNQPCT
jgi:uncharacterized repeat protein (TIGR01451 family)